MHAIKQAQHRIAADPGSDQAMALADLVVALESDQSFTLDRLYQLDMPTFELAIDVIKDWRLSRYYTSKSKLLDMSMQTQELAAAG